MNSDWTWSWALFSLFSLNMCNSSGCSSRSLVVFTVFSVHYKYNLKMWQKPQNNCPVVEPALQPASLDKDISDICLRPCRNRQLWVWHQEPGVSGHQQRGGSLVPAQKGKVWQVKTDLWQCCFMMSLGIQSHEVKHLLIITTYHIICIIVVCVLWHHSTG